MHDRASVGNALCGVPRTCNRRLSALQRNATEGVRYRMPTPIFSLDKALAWRWRPPTGAAGNDTTEQGEEYGEQSVAGGEEVGAIDRRHHGARGEARNRIARNRIAARNGVAWNRVVWNRGHDHLRWSRRQGVLTANQEVAGDQPLPQS